MEGGRVEGHHEAAGQGQPPDLWGEGRPTPHDLLLPLIGCRE